MSSATCMVRQIHLVIVFLDTCSRDVMCMIRILNRCNQVQICLWLWCWVRSRSWISIIIVSWVTSILLDGEVILVFCCYLDDVCLIVQSCFYRNIFPFFTENALEVNLTLVTRSSEHLQVFSVFITVIVMQFVTNDVCNSIVAFQCYTSYTCIMVDIIWCIDVTVVF